jgi:hypothetical protein
VPFEFAVLAESVRQARIVRRPGFCKSTFLSLAGMRRVRNTPGALLQQIEEMETVALRDAAAYGSPASHTLSFPINSGPKMFGPSYFELLFGFMFERPCLAEVEATCGVTLGKDRIFKLVHTGRQSVQMNASAADLLALKALGMPRVLEVSYVRHKPKIVWESPMRPRSITRLPPMYERMRRLVPLVTPYVNAQGVIRIFNIAVHVRAGGGARTVPQSAYLPLLDFLADTFDDVRARTRTVPGTAPRTCAPHVHVFHEYEDGRCCEHIEAWGRRRAIPGMRMFVDMDPQRQAMWHAMWMADMLIAGESKLTESLGVLSTQMSLFIDGSTGNGMPTAHALRSIWRPCGPLKKANWSQWCSVSPNPEIGLGAQGMAAVRETLERFCRGPLTA